jgi:hypothetical protein
MDRVRDYEKDCIDAAGHHTSHVVYETSFLHLICVCGCSMWRQWPDMRTGMPSYQAESSVRSTPLPFVLNICLMIPIEGLYAPPRTHGALETLAAPSSFFAAPFFFVAPQR